MNLLISAFDAFGYRITNTSLQAIERIRITDSNCIVEKVILPVIYDFTPFQSILEEKQPNLVIMLGEAGNRSKICLELRAINLADARIADNAGVMMTKQIISIQGDEYLHTDLNLRLILSKLKNDLLEESLSAGSYVCNYQYYQTLRYFNHKTPCLFIHVPYSKEEGYPDRPALQDIVLSIEQVITEVLKTMF